jgi:hypothetical protein
MCAVQGTRSTRRASTEAMTATSNYPVFRSYQGGGAEALVETEHFMGGKVKLEGAALQALRELRS